MDDIISLARTLISIESTDPGSWEGDVAAFLKDYLSDLSLTCIPVAEGREDLLFTLGDMTQPALILCAHMDTVVFGEGWQRDPLSPTIENGRLYGRGSCDMKSGLAIAAHLMKQLYLSQKEIRHPIALLCTVDEEADMLGIQAAIDGHYIRSCDYLIDLEPTECQIQPAHKGRFWLEVTADGKTAHASRPNEGADAVAAMAQFITALRRPFRQLQSKTPETMLGHPTITFGQIRGGYQPYVVPDRCKLWIDIRLAPPLDRDGVLKLVREAAAEAEEAVPGVTLSQQITGDRPYILPHEEAPLYQLLAASYSQVTARSPRAELFSGYTDTAVAAGQMDNINCLSFGPGSLEQAHKPDEYVSLDQLETCTAVIEHLAEHWIS